jgi:DNA mismatch repair protein MutS
MEMGSSMNLNGASGYGSTGNLADAHSTDIMEIDNTTYEDLSLFSRHEEYSLFHKLNFTRTQSGRDLLQELFVNPLDKLEDIHATQQIIGRILEILDQWPSTISNGTIMVMDKFYETAIDDIPAAHNLPAAFGYKFFHTADYAMVRYSVGHFVDFVRGMNQLVTLLNVPDNLRLLSELLERARRLLDQEVLQAMAKTAPGAKLNPIQIIYYGHFVRLRFKTAMQSLIEIHSRLDAWYSMAIATRRFQLHFPVFVDQAEPYLEATALYHLLLPQAVSYDVRLDKDTNFLFLTGANMAGKSTFIRSVGVVVFLAHLGMGVPAATMRLSLFDGILSNINVVDDLAKGESFFFNEVQRIRNTLAKIGSQKKWLVLIDELFKGTNVQDAMKCSTTVIKGLIRIRKSLFILSTHLYEIGEELKGYPNILFRYFETNVVDDQLEFSYQLKEGISNDRIGYLILKREKVVEMLEKL